MNNKSKRARRKSTTRIYYAFSDGVKLFWTVPFKDATQKVRLNGNVLDVMNGERGQVIGCHLSNCAQRNAKQFPHPCLLAAFTKSRAFIVTKIRRGQPVECIRYAHSYGKIVDLNDIKSPTKAYLLDHPELENAKFILTPPPPKRKAAKAVSRPPGERNGSQHVTVSRGALQRAVSAGLVSSGLENAFA